MDSFTKQTRCRHPIAVQYSVLRDNEQTNITDCLHCLAGISNLAFKLGQIGPKWEFLRSVQYFAEPECTETYLKKI